MVLQRGNAAFRLLHPAAALKFKRLGDDADGQHAHVVGDFGHDGRRARPGAAPHARGDEDHVAPPQGSGNRLAALVGGFLAHLRLGAGALAVRHLFANLDFLCRFRAVKRLAVGIDADELDALHAGRHHPVNRVSAAAAHSDHFYLYDIVKIVVDFKRHVPHPPYVSPLKS